MAKKQKPLSPRRAREFRDRRLKRLYGDRKARAERWAMLVRNYGKVVALDLSRNTLRVTGT